MLTPSARNDRCVVGIVDSYKKRCPKDSLLNAFYLKPLQKFKAKSVWYSTVPLGHSKLNSLVKIMKSEAGVEGYYLLIIRYEQPLLVDCSKMM